jgi:hypothetical protein
MGRPQRRRAATLTAAFAACLTSLAFASAAGAATDVTISWYGVSPSTIDVGASVYDSVEIQYPGGGPVATGTVTFDAYGPDDADCTGPVTFSSTTPIIDEGLDQNIRYGYASSAAFKPTSGGVYRFVGSYSGDANYNGAPGACNDPGTLVTVHAAAATFSPTSLTYASAQSPQPVGTIGPSQQTTVTNTGDAALNIYGFSFTGADPDDFIVSSDTCRQTIVVGASCMISARFAPQASGARSATLSLTSNSGANAPSSTVSLTGSATPLATGAAGADGATGADGAAGAAGTAGADGSTGTAGAEGTVGLQGATGGTGVAGARGATGRSDRVTCIVFRAHRNSAGNLIHTMVRCTTSRAARTTTRMTLRQGGRILATGSAQGRHTVLRPKAVKRGAYTVTVTRRVGTRSTSHVQRFVAR